MNDIQGRSYLVRHVLHKLRLLFTGLTSQHGSLLQFRSALFGFLFCLFGIVDVLTDASPHLAEGVLQLSDQVSTLAEGQGLFIVSVSDLPQLCSQQA